MDEFTSPVSDQPLVEPTTVELVQILAHIDRELLDQVRHLNSDPSQVIDVAVRQWLSDRRTEGTSAQLSGRRTEGTSAQRLFSRNPPIRPWGERIVTDLQPDRPSTEVLERLASLELSMEKFKEVISSLNIEEGVPPVQQYSPSRPKPKNNHLRIKGDRAIAFSSGGAFLGGIVAQIPGAVIGGLFGFIFAAIYKPKRVKVHGN